MSNEPKPSNKATVTVAIIGAIATVLAAILGAVLSPNIISPLISTPMPSLTPLSNLDQILTADAIDTQRAVDKAVIIAMATQNAQATSTQQYIDFYNTAQASIRLTQIYQKAEQDLATSQSVAAGLTAQAGVSNQGTATALAVTTIQEKIGNFWSQSSGLQPVFSDTFDNNFSGWHPISTSNSTVTIDNSQLNVSIPNIQDLPLFVYCDKCGYFENFMVQIDLTTPSGVGSVYAGILLGSPTLLDKYSYQYTYEVLLDSAGAIYLKRLSPAGEKTYFLEDKLTNIISPDGKPRTIQIIVYEKYMSIYINGVNIVSAYQLDEPIDGYVGLIVSTAGNTKIHYDNLKIFTMP